MTPATGNRRRSRILALQALYEADTSSHLPEEAIDRRMERKSESELVVSFARVLIRGVGMNRAEIDRIISESAPQWPLADVAVVDRNILRLAIYEVLFDNETPVRAAVNEAVDLARTFGSENSARFVNGVLGTVAAKTAR